MRSWWLGTDAASSSRLDKGKLVHYVTFIDDLQVPCILGIDFMSKHQIVIDAAQRKMKYYDAEPLTRERVLLVSKPIH